MTACIVCHDSILVIALAMELMTTVNSEFSNSGLNKRTNEQRNKQTNKQTNKQGNKQTNKKKTKKTRMYQGTNE